MSSAAHSADDNLGPVRPQHRIDEKKLSEFLADHLPGFRPPLVLRQYGGGQSNPTFALRTGGGDFVLRKKPPGDLAASAHAIDREFRVQSALAGSAVPVARMHLYCDDSSIIGTPFYVMEHLDGRVFRNPRLPDLSPHDRASVFAEMGTRLAALHQIDVAAVGLADFGRGEGYLARQLERSIRQYRSAMPEPTNEMEALAKWLPPRLPADDLVTLVHGDFRLENLVFHKSGQRIVGVLDWELSTLGHPLADLAHNCLPHHISVITQPGFTDGRPEGAPSEADYVAAYQRATGRTIPPDQWRWALAFALFRLAAICAGVYRRGVAGNASSELAVRFLEITRNCAEAGSKLINSD